jgi:hypothetical protein
MNATRGTRSSTITTVSVGALAAALATAAPAIATKPGSGSSLGQFDYAPDTSFSAAAKATYAEALIRDGQAAANLVRARFAARHITF